MDKLILPDPSTMLAIYLRRKHAVAAAKRYISRDLRNERVLSADSVIPFLQRRLPGFPEEEIAELAHQAVEEWYHSPANNYQG